MLVTLSSLEKKYFALYHGTLPRKRLGHTGKPGPCDFIMGTEQEAEDPQSGEGIRKRCPDTELALKGQRENEM